MDNVNWPLTLVKSSGILVTGVPELTTLRLSHPHTEQFGGNIRGNYVSRCFVLKPFDVKKAKTQTLAGRGEKVVLKRFRALGWQDEDIKKALLAKRHFTRVTALIARSTLCEGETANWQPEDLTSSWDRRS